MKNLIGLILALLCSTVMLKAQDTTKKSKPNTVITADGNYKAASFKVNSNALAGRDTGKKFITVKGESFTVFESENKKLYIKRISKKTGKEYKQYLKLE